MKQIKIIVDNMGNLEERLNKFLLENNLDVIDIKFSMSQMARGAMIIYEEKQTQTNKIN